MRKISLFLIHMLLPILIFRKRTSSEVGKICIWAAPNSTVIKMASESSSTPSSDYFTEKKEQGKSLPTYPSTAHLKPALPVPTLSKRWSSNSGKEVDPDRYNTVRDPGANSKLSTHSL
jgi:hypothetical protein